MIFSRSTKEISPAEREQGRTLISVRELDPSKIKDKETKKAIPTADYELIFQTPKQENWVLTRYYVSYDELMKLPCFAPTITEKDAKNAELATVKKAVEEKNVDIKPFLQKKGLCEKEKKAKRSHKAKEGGKAK